MVTNVSQVGWNEVAEFPPFGAENNVSSYLQWAIPLTKFSVSTSWYFYMGLLNAIKVNGTEFTPSPTFASSSLKQSLALFDV